MNNQKYCPNCGAEMNVNNDYCSNCGTSITGANQTQKSVSDVISDIVDQGNAFFSKYMFKEETWWQVMLLSIITLGGFGVYYWYRQMKEIELIEINQMNKQVDRDISFIWFLLLYYVSATIAGFVFVIVYYKRLVTVAKELYGINLNPKSAIIYSILMYVPVYSWYLSVKNHNKVIAMYKHSVIVPEPVIRNRPINISNSDADAYPDVRSIENAANAGLDDF